MSEESQDVDLETFAAHIESGAEAQGYQEHFGHYGPKGTIRDNDPAPQAPTWLEALDPESVEDEPLC